MVNQVGKYNNQYQSAVPSQLNNPNTQVAMSGVDKEKVKQNVQAVTDNVKDKAQDNYLSTVLNDYLGEDWQKTSLITVPIWYGLAQGMDKFAEKCRGNYNSTIQYKIGDFGDKVANRFETSAIGKSSATKGVKSFFKNVASWYNTKVLPKSAILRALKTPSVPECPHAIGPANGVKGYIAMDYPQYADNFLKPLKSAADLDCYGASLSKIAKVENEIAHAADAATKANILQRAEFELLNDGRETVSEFLKKSAAEKATLLRDLKAKAMGYKDVADFEAVKKIIHTNEGIERVIEACQKAGDKYTSRIWGSKGSKYLSLKGKIIGRDVKFSEGANKLIGSLGTDKIGKFASPHKTWLGKMLPKASNIFLEASTNRVGGGKFVAVMQAYWLAGILMKTAKAEKGDKIKTFMERFTELLGFFIFMPMAIRLMHKAGGLQYAGMSKDQVEAYRKAVKGFNAKADFGMFASRKEYKVARKELRKMLRANTKNPITRLLKRAGRIITVGLEQLRPYSKNGADKGASFLTSARMQDIARHPKYWFKQAAGWPIRFILPMMIIMPFLSKLGIKVSHAIFGRPKHSTLDEGKEPKAQEQPLTQADVLRFQQLLDTAKQTENSRTGNLLNQYRNNTPFNRPATTYAPNTVQPNVTNRVVNNTINNTVNNLKKENDDRVEEPVRTYIPSPMGVQLTNPDMSAVQEALKKADIAEQEALKALRMK